MHRSSSSCGAFVLAAAMSACGSSSNDAPASDAAVADTASPDSAVSDSALPGIDSTTTDAPTDGTPPPALRHCPTSGRGAVTGDVCLLVTPSEAGLPSSGAGAAEDQYALRPTSPSRGRLLLFFNGSGGTPRGGVATADVSFYSVARDAGLHVLGVSYRSDDSIGSLCAGKDPCFEPTRRTILSGVFQTGAASSLSSIAVHEGVYARVASTLATLAAGDPAGGWDAYFDRALLADPAKALKWSSILVSGHSQGGGHAALLGKLHPVDRVVMLSSPCDSVAGTPASWLTGDASFATDPATRYFGLGAPGDTICAAYAAAWSKLGMPASASKADAVVCTDAGISGPHGASIRCIENAPTWSAQLAK
jgi:hypothetical protein